MAGSVSVLLVRPLVMALGSANSANLGTFFAATDLTPELVGDDDARISPSQFCIAWAELMRCTSPEIALSIARSTPPGAFGLVEYVCRSSPTLGDALRQWVRYLNLLSPVIVGLEVDGDRAAVRVERESEAPAPGAHELCFALLAQQARQLCTQPFRLVSVEFAHRTSGDPATYRAWFDAPVQFGADRTQIVFPRAALDASLVTADPKLLAILTRAASEIAAKKPPDATLASQVARVLGEALRNDESDIERVAKRLGMTSRSLQRRLKEEGTSFNVVREEVRKELSRRYLADDLSIAEISFLLGFSEPSAFFRAFKRWTGTTPLEARRRAAHAT